MELLFLGTSSGTPTKARNVTGIALREEQSSDWYLIDCGEGTQHQLLHTNLSLNTLQGLFITHVHGDHCYGLLGLLASAGMQGRRELLKIVAPKGIKEWLAATQAYTQLHLPFALEFIFSDDLPTLACKKITMSTTALSHRVPSYAYSFVESHVEPNLNFAKLTSDNIPQGPLWGKIKKGIDIEHQGKIVNSKDYLLYDHKPRKIVIAGDNDQPALLTDACVNCNVLVHEATYTKETALKVGDSVGHSYAELVAAFAATHQIPNLVLTHFSARYQADTDVSPSILDIQNEAQSAYSGNLFLAQDFANYKLEKSGHFYLIEKA